VYSIVVCVPIINCLPIDTALIVNYYGIEHIQSPYLSNVLCKLRYPGGHVLFTVSRNFSKLYIIIEDFNNICSFSDRCSCWLMNSLFTKYLDSIDLPVNNSIPCHCLYDYEFSSDVYSTILFFRWQFKSMYDQSIL
jgi:hypothetical protein